VLRLRRRKLAPPSFNLSASPERGADRAEVESRAKVAKRTLMRPSFVAEARDGARTVPCDSERSARSVPRGRRGGFRGIVGAITVESEKRIGAPRSDGLVNVLL
jgi:hypothetical protein